jgi:steroid delta-isomerase-like uncharacterized protein
MSSRNVDTIRTIYESMNRGDLNPMLSTMNDNCTYEQHVTGPDGRVGETLHGKQAYKELLDRRRQAVSNAKVTNTRYVDGGDVVVSEFTIEGTNDGQVGDMPATHRQVSFDVCEIWHFDKNGRITNGSCYFDVYTLLTRLGLMKPLSRAA